MLGCYRIPFFSYQTHPRPEIISTDLDFESVGGASSPGVHVISETKDDFKKFLETLRSLNVCRRDDEGVKLGLEQLHAVLEIGDVLKEKNDEG